jgi:hypothetical protein
MKSIEMLGQIAKGLGPLREKVVFVGGSAVALYLMDPAVPGIRPTEDVDCVIKLVTRAEYYKLEEQLRKLGFQHVAEHNAPICRWRYHGLTADIMPTEGSVLDFKNKWYPEGYTNSEEVKLPSGQMVRIFSLPYFLASKIEAFQDRGRGDFLLSPDMEDIIAVLDGAENIEEKVFQAPKRVKSYLKEKFSLFMANERFLESLDGNLVSPSGSSGRVSRVRAILGKIAGGA